MNLKKVIKFIKKFFQWSDQEVADYFGVSRPQVTKINAGYWEGISCGTIKKISELVRISIDELLENNFLPPSYHISKHIYSVFIAADQSYPEFFIQKGDYMYIRPFVHDESKIGQFVLVRRGQSYRVDKYGPAVRDAAVDFHIVGITRFMYKPMEDIEYQRKLGDEHKEKVIRRGAPIKF